MHIPRVAKPNDRPKRRIVPNVIETCSIQSKTPWNCDFSLEGCKMRHVWHLVECDAYGGGDLCSYHQFFVEGRLKTFFSNYIRSFGDAFSGHVASAGTKSRIRVFGTKCQYRGQTTSSYMGMPKIGKANWRHADSSKNGLPPRLVQTVSRLCAMRNDAGTTIHAELVQEKGGS